MALVGNLRLWTVQELVSSVLFCNHKSIQDEAVRKVCENFQYLDMGIFVHILSSSDLMSLSKIKENNTNQMSEEELKLYNEAIEFLKNKNKELGLNMTDKEIEDLVSKVNEISN